MLPARNGIEDSRQFDLEPGHERTLRRLVEQHGGLAQQRFARPDIVVVAGDVEQHGDQVARIQTAEERLEVFGGRLGHSCMVSTIRRRQTPALACARDAGFASMA
ncbi:MAG: hypothetical protein J0L91_03430 [Burkholderiales bacterium]|nr:hypothetical protein [Burkholderiales bacterium]